MKKFLSIALALVMVLSLGAVAFADGDDFEYANTQAFTITEVIKKYTSDVTVNEKVNFTCAQNTGNPDNGVATPTVNELTVDFPTDAKTQANLTINVPALSVAGTYTWEIKETAAGNAGIVYSSDSVFIIVYVGYDNDSATKSLKVLNTTTYIKKASDESKAKEFTNTFEHGSFSVAKNVDGNMARLDDEFTISVTLESTKPVVTAIKIGETSIPATSWVKNSTTNKYTYNTVLTLCENDGATTFSLIPTGVAVTVSEDSDAASELGYTYKNVTYDGSVANNVIIAKDASVEIIVNNEKSTTVDTGVSMDSIPYVVLLTVACLGLVVLLAKKRTARDF